MEVLSALRAIDPAAHPAGLDYWFHVWSVLGYAMGVEPELLPRSYEVPILLEGELGMLVATDPRVKSLPVEKARKLEADSLSQAIAISPGLGPALGLVSGDTQELLRFVHP